MKREELIHFKIQAAIREHNIPEKDLKYIGEGQGTYWYLINNKHSVPVNMIESFDRVDEN